MSSSGDRRDELAEQRTEWAVQRTLLAEERTYSAWVRTGLASTATGFAVAKVMGDAEPLWVAHTLAILFILAGASMFVLAFWAYRDALLKAADASPGGVPMWILAMLSLVLFIGAGMGLYLIW